MDHLRITHQIHPHLAAAVADSLFSDASLMCVPNFDGSVPIVISASIKDTIDPVVEFYDGRATEPGERPLGRLIACASLSYLANKVLNQKFGDGRFLIEGRPELSRTGLSIRMEDLQRIVSVLHGRIVQSADFIWRLRNQQDGGFVQRLTADAAQRILQGEDWQGVVNGQQYITLAKAPRGDNSPWDAEGREMRVIEVKEVGKLLAVSAICDGTSYQSLVPASKTSGNSSSEGQYAVAQASMELEYGTAEWLVANELYDGLVSNCSKLEPAVTEYICGLGQEQVADFIREISMQCGEDVYRNAAVRRMAISVVQERVSLAASSKCRP